MIQHISINNFKSIKHINFDCKKVNVFIGGPNAGKSNILEAISLLSGKPPKDLGLRFKVADQLFYDHEVSVPIQVAATLTKEAIAQYAINVEQVALDYQYIDGITMNHPLPQVRFYKHPTDQIDVKFGQYLLPPFGQNLFTLLQMNPDFRAYVSMVFQAKGYRLGIRADEQEIDMIRDKDRSLYQHPYCSLSDTIKRDIFYTGILDTNQNKVLLLENPSDGWHPNDFIHFAERIAFDESNQFFISTHNIGFLSPLFGKSYPKDINVIIVYTENYETKLYTLTEEERLDIFDMDIITNLHHYIDIPY